MARSHWRYPTALRSSVLGLMAAAAMLSLAACSGGSNPTGTAAFKLTDAPACGDFTSVVVTITGIQLIGNDGTPYTLTLNPPIQQDLLKLTNGATINLGQVTAPAGTYDQLRLLLASNSGGGGTPANYVTTSSGGTYPLTTPSAQQSGYKIDGSVTVTANGTVNVTVDFNACRSIVVAGNSGQYILKPVLHEMEDDESGAISGSLPAADAGAVVMAEDAEGRIVKTTVADASGNFTLSPLEATTSGGYNVVVAPPQPASGSSTSSPDFAPDVVLNVPVTAGQTVTLPSPLPANPSTGEKTYAGTVTPTMGSDPDVLVVAQDTIANGSANDVVTIAETNAVESGGSGGAESYSLTVDVTAPYVASYNATSLSFSQVSPAPTPTIRGFGSDGSTGTAVATTTSSGTSYDITLSGSGDGTYEADN